MNGQDAKKVWTGIQLSGIQRSIVRNSIKLEKTIKRIESHNALSKVPNMQLLDDKDTLEKALKKFKEKETKLLAIMQADAPNLDEAPSQAAELTPPINVPTDDDSLMVNDVIELDGIEYKVVEQGYKVAKIGKEGKATKQIKYVAKKDIV